MRRNSWVALTVLVLMFPGLASAQIDFDPSKNTIGNHGKKLVDSSGSIKALTYLTASDDPATISIRLTNVVLSLLGIASMILLLYGGIVWFKSRDNEEEIKRAKQIMQGALTGLIITLMAYGLAQLLFNQLQTATTGSGAYEPGAIVDGS